MYVQRHLSVKLSNMAILTFNYTFEWLLLERVLGRHDKSQTFDERQWNVNFSRYLDGGGELAFATGAVPGADRRTGELLRAALARDRLVDRLLSGRLGPRPRPVQAEAGRLERRRPSFRLSVCRERNERITVTGSTQRKRLFNGNKVERPLTGFTLRFRRENKQTGLRSRGTRWKCFVRARGRDVKAPGGMGRGSSARTRQ